MGREPSGGSLARSCRGQRWRRWRRRRGGCRPTPPPPPPPPPPPSATFSSSSQLPLRYLQPAGDQKLGPCREAGARERRNKSGLSASQSPPTLRRPLPLAWLPTLPLPTSKVKKRASTLQKSGSSSTGSFPQRGASDLVVPQTISQALHEEEGRGRGAFRGLPGQRPLPPPSSHLPPRLTRARLSAHSLIAPPSRCPRKAK